MSTPTYPVVDRIEVEPRWVTAQASFDAAKAHTRALRKGPETNECTMADVMRWLETLEFEVAPEGHMIHREILRKAYDAELIGGVVDDDTFMSAFGTFLKRRFGNEVRKRKSLYNVTCKLVQSERFVRAKVNKKAQRLAKRGATDPAASRTTVQSDGASVRYFTEFMQLDCAPGLLEHKLFPDAKELSESFGAFNAWRVNLSKTFRADDEDVTLISVGDGQTPRTAALFAYRTKWQCIAVDPEMNEKGRTFKIERLQYHRSRIEELRITTKRALVVMVHAHVSLEATLASITTADGTAGCIAVPCCNWYVSIDSAARPKVTEYQDLSIFSPHRLCRVWDSLACGAVYKHAPHSGS